MIPVLEKLKRADRILFAGCGGGFDIFSGVPIAEYAVARSKELVFANLSFTNLWMCGGERVAPTTWRIDRESAALPYFPERLLSEWLKQRGRDVPIYAFAKSGVRPLAAAYKLIIERHRIGLVVLIDGGTDSVLFGDEPGLGTVTEDAVSLVAACEATETEVVLAALGFGVDDHHGVSHHSFLENAARLTREGAALGMFSITAGTPEADAFLDLVTYANERQDNQSIVCNSVASALRGDFGNVQTIRRTSGSELFINPLMTQYWTFNARGIVREMAYAGRLAKTETFGEAEAAIELEREYLAVRLRRPIPL